jgi:hypothetical protein
MSMRNSDDSVLTNCATASTLFTVPNVNLISFSSKRKSRVCHKTIFKNSQIFRSIKEF